MLHLLTNISLAEQSLLTKTTTTLQIITTFDHYQ
jgi:hypothetical protein